MVASTSASTSKEFSSSRGLALINSLPSHSGRKKSQNSWQNNKQLNKFKKIEFKWLNKNKRYSK